MAGLNGKRVLVVEDEALIAAMVEDMLLDLGMTVIGPAGSVKQAMGLAKDGGFDVAMLDVNVRGERIDPVAEMINEQGVPILFATGYGEVPLAGQIEACVIDKPYTQDKLARSITRALGLVV